MPKTILITGAAGGVAGYLRRELGTAYRLVLSDVRPVDALRAHETFRAADLTDMDALRALLPGVDAVVHLGGQSVEGSWNAVLDRNIVGAYNLFESARQEGVSRVVFASSCHAVGFYRLDETIEADAYFKPDSRYGVSKVFGEALGALYADKYGFDVLAIRIGNVAERPVDRRRLTSWLSPRDLAQLVRIGIETPALGYQVVFGMSRNTGSCWVNSTAYRLGYAPQDDAMDHADRIDASPPDPDDPAQVYQGGPFVLAETGGDPWKR
ncbi:UDP-glucose 4-epimerase [Thalassobaculum fulvum]|uniref:UDP-glucose 4-epimerase n=1 Tax=Thalassobaculum fulvum TaxID=1633335 RepID=A0A918XPT1_9PROT|nr:NAD(P)-dependent oxidoreductase [Thalassobaculum fulvum]GHD45543.1 UDP-glucose 4-epimerase [Thalassobaculum fulvum]